MIVPMYETAAELAELQALLDRSAAGVQSAQLKEIFHVPRLTLTADELVAALPDIQLVAMATVTATGEPRVGPMDSLFLHGRFHLYSDREALRVRHLARRPAISITHFEGDDLAVIVHGRAVLIGLDSTDWQAIDDAVRAAYGTAVRDWSPDGIYIRVEPTVMFTKKPGH
jgi:hypothetical protein